MMDQGLLKNNLFAFYLGTNAQGEESDLTFGYYDKTKFHGKIIWNPVIFKYMYGMRLDDILVNGKSIGVCGNGKDCIVTVDSGSSLLAMPKYAFEKISKNKRIPTTKNQVACDGVEEFGELTYIINGNRFTLEASEWVYPPQKP